MTENPYKVEGPALISFSGGRTSGYMLRHILDAGIDSDVHVCFANTGKEREETLVFVDQVARHWGVRVRWLERNDMRAALARREKSAKKAGFTSSARYIRGRMAREVNFDNASRAGQPFLALVKERNFLPNPVTRFCTQELKIRAMKDFMLGHGYTRWTNVVGLRGDEPGRVASQRAGEASQRYDLAFPLFDAGVRKEDVLAWWRCQPFDLQLRSWEGNCDLCFLKGRAKKERIVRDRPELATWWAEAEAEAEAEAVRGPKLNNPRMSRFRAHGPSYADLIQLAKRTMLPFAPEDIDGPDDLGDCFCGAD